MKSSKVLIKLDICMAILIDFVKRIPSNSSECVREISRIYATSQTDFNKWYAPLLFLRKMSPTIFLLNGSSQFSWSSSDADDVTDL